MSEEQEQQSYFPPAEYFERGYDGPRRILGGFKQNIQTYWDARHLHYLDKWLKATPEELEAAQKKSSGMSVAEYLIVKFLMIAVNSPHPSLMKMIMEMSAGKTGITDAKHPNDDGINTVKRVLLKLPKSGRLKEDKNKET